MPIQRMHSQIIPFRRSSLKPASKASQSKPVSPQRPTAAELVQFDIHLGDLFDDIFLIILEAFWLSDDELSLKHGLPMESFIRDSIPHQTLFVDQKEAFLDDATADVFDDAVDECVKLISSGIDIYVRQFIDMDLDEAYFLNARSFVEARDIAWIVDEASLADFKADSKLADVIEPNDKIYHFCSPRFSWENGFGERGIIVLRDDRIVSREVLEAS